MLLDINFLDVGNVRFQKLPMAKNGEKWRKMAKKGDGEFAFFICQIRHFAIGPPPMIEPWSVVTGHKIEKQ